MEQLIIVINENDNVAVAIDDIPAGTSIDLSGRAGIRAAVDIPFGHKVSLEALRAGEPVIKYGETIGLAAREIEADELVHTHNIESMEA